MNSQQIPLDMEGIHGSVYAGFRSRLGSLLIDAIITAPLFYLVEYLNSGSKNMYFYTLAPDVLISLWYFLYLPKRFGGTPGKLLVGLKILKINGQPIGWKQAVLREIITLTLSAVSALVMSINIIRADETVFNGLTRTRQSDYIESFSPVFFTVYSIMINVWIYSEAIILLTNPRKRAIHDYIAGTVIVKRIYIDKIRDAMGITRPGDDTHAYIH